MRLTKLTLAVSLALTSLPLFATENCFPGVFAEEGAPPPVDTADKSAKFRSTMWALGSFNIVMGSDFMPHDMVYFGAYVDKDTTFKDYFKRPIPCSSFFGGTIFTDVAAVSTILDKEGKEVPVQFNTSMWYVVKGSDVKKEDAHLVKHFPVGLFTIAGNPMNTDGYDTTELKRKKIDYYCSGKGDDSEGGVDSSNPTVGFPSCKAGQILNIKYILPECRKPNTLVPSIKNGNNTAYASNELFNDPKTHCPSSHPIRQGQYIILTRYVVNKDGETKDWSCSTDKGLAGASCHAWWLSGRNDKKAMDSIFKNCIRAEQDCGSNNLGNGTRLLRPKAPKAPKVPK
jgi:hypothetical protein